MLIALLSLPVILAGACTQAEPAQTSDLEGTTWILEQYGEKAAPKAVIDGTRITATFESSEGQVRGSAGCNQYFGDYEVSNGQLSVYGVGSTEMACMDPEGIMEQEQQYLKILQSAKSFKIENRKLLIDCGDSELVFIAREE